MKVPGKRHHETPLYLGATAGMRLLKYGMQQMHISPNIQNLPHYLPHSVIVYAVKVLSVALSTSWF